MHQMRGVLQMINHNKLRKIIHRVIEQTHDNELWFEPKTEKEAYIQNALRELHTLIEDLVDE